MKKYFITLLSVLFVSAVQAQSFEGILKVEYKDEAGKENNAEVMVKGDSLHIRKLAGGCDKYDSYIYDMKQHSLTCMSHSDRGQKTAVIFNTDKVFDLYEKNKLKAGYKVHFTQPYKPTAATKESNGVTLKEKRCNTGSKLYQIFISPAKLNAAAMIPLLRIAGYWNDQEDGNNLIVEGRTTSDETQQKSTTLKVTVVANKVVSKLFEVPKDFQKVDLNKFIADKAASPKLPELVKALAGF